MNKRNIIQPIIVMMAICSLSACSYLYDSPQNSRVYYQNQYRHVDNDGQAHWTGRRAYRAVRAEQGYHFNEARTPVAHKQRDLNWVHKQSPDNYTIEVGSSESAASVAKKLYQAPKTHRGAEFSYDAGDKKVYKGVYGTYKTREEADKAMQSLPANVRDKAKVQKFKSVQSLTAVPADEASDDTQMSHPAPAEVY